MPESVQQNPQRKVARIRRVIIGILPRVKNTKQNRDANSAISAYSGTLRLTVIPVKSRRKVVEKKSKHLGCVSRIILRKSLFFGDGVAHASEMGE